MFTVLLIVSRGKKGITQRYAAESPHRRQGNARHMTAEDLKCSPSLAGAVLHQRSSGQAGRQ